MTQKLFLAFKNGIAVDKHCPSINAMLVFNKQAPPKHIEEKVLSSIILRSAKDRVKLVTLHSYGRVEAGLEAGKFKIGVVWEIDGVEVEFVTIKPTDNLADSWDSDDTTYSICLICYCLGRHDRFFEIGEK